MTASTANLDRLVGRDVFVRGSTFSRVGTPVFEIGRAHPPRGARAAPPSRVEGDLHASPRPRPFEPLARAPSRHDGRDGTPDGPRPAASPPALTDEVRTQVDRTISELSAWNRRRRADERAARERLDADDANDADDDADDDFVALDAELAAAMAAVGVGSLGSPDADAKPSARGGRTVPARVPSIPRRPRPMSAAARRGGTRELARRIGPDIGAGVFGAKDDPAEAAAEAVADEAADEAGGEEDLAFASAVASWTKDVDAVLSRLDACEEVGRAKGAFFEEQGR